MARTEDETRHQAARRAPAAGVALVAGLVLGGILLTPSGGAAQPQTVPSNTTEPQILGSVVVGDTLATSNGSWSGTTPMSFSYRWLRCSKSGGRANGSDCGVLSGETNNTYQLRNADVGSRMRVRVTASNVDGSAAGVSNPTDTVIAGRPLNTNPPTISGVPRQGQTQTADPGTWSGRQPISFAYLWRRCNSTGGSCTNVFGATGRTYTLQAADNGRTLRVRVTARNSAGSSSATSVPTAVIGASPATGCPSGSFAFVSDVSPPARLVVDRLEFSPSVVTRSTQTVVGRFHVIDTCGQPVQGALVYATAVPFNQLTPLEEPTARDGWATIDFRVLAGFPAARGQQLLVIFTRARKPGENLLAGISTRRLVSVRVSGG
jgi:hypothetical protein